MPVDLTPLINEHVADCSNMRLLNRKMTRQRVVGGDSTILSL